MTAWLHVALAGVASAVEGAPAAPAGTGDGVDPLELAEVLEAVDARVPQLAASVAKLEAAEGKVLAARGAFDPTLVGKGGAYEGPYDRAVADVGVGVASALGPRLEVGWAYGQGKFPAYDGDRETGELGEGTVALSVPLLQGLIWGPDRAALLVADATADLAEADLRLKGLEVRRKAAESWWKWAGAGAKLALERELLSLAEGRQIALDRQVQAGALAELDALDHRRTLAKRRANVLKAEQELIIASVVLSLWYRDDEGAPRVPTEAELPELPLPGDPLAPAEEPAAEDLSGALQRRPDLAGLDARAEAARVEVRAANNLRLPGIDAIAEASRDLEVAPASELFVGLALKAPLLQRKGRGAQQAARATLDMVEAERQALADQVAVEVVAARQVRDASARRALALQEAAELAARVARLEQRAFELGSSDLFRVLARETTLGEAGREALDERVGWGLAEAAYEAVIAAP